MTGKGMVVVVVLGLGSGAARGQLAETYSFAPVNPSVPDGNAAGWSDVQAVTSSIVKIGTIRVRLKVSGEFNGDLYGYVRHVGNADTNFCVLLNRPGRSGSNSFGYDDAGMDVGFEDGATNGDIHVYGSVTNLPAGVALTGIWGPDGRTNDPGVVVDSSARATSLATFAGADANGEWTLFMADMDSGGANSVVSWGLEIAGQEKPEITWVQPPDITYGMALSTDELNATAGVPGRFEYRPPAGTVLHAGSNQVLSVTFTPDDEHSYVPVTVAVPITVQPKDLVITAEDANKVYGAPLPGFSASYQGFANGDTPASLTSPVVLGTTGTMTSDVGTYAITGSGASSPDYAIRYVPGVLTITRAQTQGQVSASANPAAPGQMVVFTFTATAVAPGAGVPTGMVQFKVDGVAAGGPVTLSGGTAEMGISSVVAGVHGVSAEYAGDMNFIGTTNTLTGGQLINTPPAPGTVVIERDATNGTKVAVATLVASAFDADGDTIALVGVSTNSASGGTVTTNGGWIFYAPPAGFTNSDSFTYQISDGHWAPVTGVVTVNVRVDNGPSPNLTISTLPDGSYRIQFNGIYGRRYRIQYTEDLGSGTWTTLGSATADEYGRYEYVDRPGGGVGYYRAVYP